MPELDTNITTFEQNFSVFDTAAHGGRTDNRVSREDVEAVANGSQYSPAQRQAAQYLLDNPAAFALLDTGRDGGGLYAADGVISREDVAAVFDRASLFADTGTFVSDSAVIPEDTVPGFDDPTAAAAQTENVAFGAGEESATSQFMYFVSEHQDDAAWLQGYFGSLGSERTAELLGNVANASRYADLSAAYASQEIATARNALQTMYDSGALTDADIGRLVEGWAMERGDFNPGVAELFAGLEGSSAQGMQNAFARASTELALSDQDLNNRAYSFSDDSAERLSGGDRESLAAAAAHVLGQTSWENSTSALIDLQADGGNGAVDRFISLAMSNPTSIPGLTAYTADAERARLNGGAPIAASEIAYDGVAQLVEGLSYDTTYRGGIDRYLPPAPYSYNALQSVRDQVFYSAANGIDANGQWQTHTGLKDSLSRILVDDFDRMVGEASTANGARLDDDHPFPQAFENFAEHVLFSEPSGTLRDRTSDFLVDRLSTLVIDVNTLDAAAFVDKYGADQTQMSHIAGAILGHIDNGAEQAVQSASDRHEAQKAGLEFALDLGWALAQDGLKLLPGGSVAAAILPDSISGSSSFAAIQGQVESLLQEGLTDQAVELLLEEFPGLVPDDALQGLTQELSESISATNEGDYLSSLLSEFTDVDLRRKPE